MIRHIFSTSSIFLNCLLLLGLSPRGSRGWGATIESPVVRSVVGYLFPEDLSHNFSPLEEEAVAGYVFLRVFSHNLSHSEPWLNHTHFSPSISSFADPGLKTSPHSQAAAVSFVQQVLLRLELPVERNSPE